MSFKTVKCYLNFKGLSIVFVSAFLVTAFSWHIQALMGLVLQLGFTHLISGNVVTV